MHMLALFLDDTTVNTVNPQLTSGIIAAFLGVYVVLWGIIAVVLIIPTWFISKKAGFSPWFSLVNIVPTFGLLIWLYVVAFSEWKTAPSTAVAAWQPPPPPAPPQA